MKNAISIIAGLITAWAIFFKLDPWIVSSIMEAFAFESPDTASLVKLGLWVVIIIFSTGLTFAVSIMVGGLVRILLK